MTAFQRKRIRQIERDIARRRREINERPIMPWAASPLLLPAWAGKFMAGCAIAGIIGGLIIGYLNNS